MKKVNTFYSTIIIASIMSLFVACGDSENEGINTVEEIGKTQLLSAEVIEDINSSTMLALINGSRAEADKLEFAFGYKAVKITYNTVGQDGEEFQASGLLTIPTPDPGFEQFRISQDDGAFTVSMIADHHGTLFENSEAPTNVEIIDGGPNYSLGISMTGIAGFAGIFPDYIGYGESSDIKKPYLLKNGNAQASLDMIKASMKYMIDSDVALNYQLFISGYSEGGYVALSLAQEVEKTFSNSVNLMGVAPMAAPSLLKIFGDNVLKNGANMSVPAFMAFIADSYSTYYDNLSLNEMILDSLESEFENLFDGTNDITAIHTTLGLAPGAASDTLFETSFINEYETNDDHKLKLLFEENDVVKWNSKSKINFYHCTNDEVIPSTMSDGAVATMKQYGTLDVIVTKIDGVTSIGDQSIHSSCAQNTTIGSYVQALGWFAKIRTGEIK